MIDNTHIEFFNPYDRSVENVESTKKFVSFLPENILKKLYHISNHKGNWTIKFKSTPSSLDIKILIDIFNTHFHYDYIQTLTTPSFELEEFAGVMGDEQMVLDSLKKMNI